MFKLLAKLLIISLSMNNIGNISYGEEIIEVWDGKEYKRQAPKWYQLPKDKHKDRGSHQCLAQWDYPGVLSQLVCGEESPESTFLQPAMRVRVQSCGLIWCSATSYTLKDDGACVTFPSVFVGKNRVCARVANPAYTDSEGKNHAATTGYTEGKHLNYEGAKKADEGWKTADGTIKKTQRPKLCLYEDPGLVTLNLLDPFDNSKTYQPFHAGTTEIHPFIKILIWLVEQSEALGQALAGLIETLIDMIFGGSNNSSKAQTGGETEKHKFEWISKLFKNFFNAAVKALKWVGTLNRVATAKNECVELPLGPMPPPFCSALSFYPTPSVTKICPNSYGETKNATSNFDQQCVHSEIGNNYVQNALRISFDNFVPFCSDKHTDPLKTDQCVRAENTDSIGSFSASLLHLSTNKRDILPACTARSSSKGEALCVSGIALNNCIKMRSNCQVRVVYSRVIGSAESRNQAYRDDLPDCSVSSKTICQKPWGINLGEFQDVSLSLKNFYEDANLMPITKNISLSYKAMDGKTVNENFTAIINRSKNEASISPAGFSASSEKICVYAARTGSAPKLLECMARTLKPKLSVYECDNIKCRADHFKPQMLIGYHIFQELDPPIADADAAEIIDRKTIARSLAKLRVANSHEPDENNNLIANLQGDEFKAFVTDDNFVQMPFSTADAADERTLFAKYRKGTIPAIRKFDKSQEANEMSESSKAKWLRNFAAIYQGGIEYVDGQYVYGGKYMCLQDDAALSCEKDPKLCVLGKLQNTDTVPCKDFKTKEVAYQMPLKPCKKWSFWECLKKVDSLVTKDNKSIDIKECTPSGRPVYYCYDSKQELCSVTNGPEARQVPAANFGKIIPDSEYFETDTKLPEGTKENPIYAPKNINYDVNFLRSKTALERGLCVAVAQGTCQAQDDYSQENGYAYWPETKGEETAIGQCQDGKKAKGPLKRKCLPRHDHTFALEPLYNLSLKKDFIMNAQDNVATIQEKLGKAIAAADQQTQANGASPTTSDQQLKMRLMKCTPLQVFDIMARQETLNVEEIESSKVKAVIDYLVTELELIYKEYENSMDQLIELCYTKKYNNEIMCE
jgi:hypothetical protein